MEHSHSLTQPISQPLCGLLERARESSSDLIKHVKKTAFSPIPDWFYNKIMETIELFSFVLWIICSQRDKEAKTFISSQD